MRAIWINTPARIIQAVRYDGLADLQRMVNGSISLAGYTTKGDTVYVDDDGLFRFEDYFEMPGVGQQIFAGPGVIVGKEIGQTANTRDPKTKVEEVTSLVRFYSGMAALRRCKELGL